MGEPAEPPSRPARRLLIDLTPLRRSRDFRRLVSGELVSVLGTQLTTVAVPYQVYELTRSSLAVGLVSVTQLFPLIAGSLLAGSVVDAMDRRRLLMVAQVLMACCSAGLAVNADLGPALWPLFVLPALAAGVSGLDSAGRNAIVPNMVRRSEVSTANAIFQTLFQLGLVAGPALAGLLLAGAGVRFVYWMDVASFGVALLAVFLISPFVGRILDWHVKAGGGPYTAETDPGVASVRAIYAYYKAHGIGTYVMGASFRNAGEVEALAGCDRLTIAPALLDALAADRGRLVRRLDPTDPGEAPARLILDERRFRFLLNQDAMATEKLAEGIRLFVKDLYALRALVRNVLLRADAA